MSARQIRITRIDPDAWRPLIMSFQHYYGLGGRLHPSRLASIDEEWYRLPGTAEAVGPLS